MGVGLAVLNRLAGAPLLDQLRGPLERAIFAGSTAGFRTAGAANRRFTAVRSRGTPQRLAAGGEQSTSRRPTN